MDTHTLQKAMDGDINAFQELFAEFQEALRSYVYRLTASRHDADDLTHDTFIKAFDKLGTFRGESSLKTWVFQIATNLSYNMLQKRKRWTLDVTQKAKDLVMQNTRLQESLGGLPASSAFARYEIKEHIDTCFTCIAKNLPIENQVALILKDIYDFSLKEIMEIMSLSEGRAKYLLQNARDTMGAIFEQRCALVNKDGVCHQCSELNTWFNPQQNQQEAKVRVQMGKVSSKYDREALLALRTKLVKQIDPLRSPGNALQEKLMDCNRMAMGELPIQN